MIEFIKTLIANGENQKVEFKKAKNDFPKDAYETICAFLNSNGGTLLLGIDDLGNIVGVNPASVERIKTKFVTDINNPEIINPVTYLTIHDMIIDDKVILYVQVPNASSVYRYKSRIYLRNHSSDMDITNNQEEVTRLYLRTDNTFSENQIFPNVEIGDLRTDLITKVVKIVKRNNPQLDWTELSTKEFLQKNKLYKIDKAKNIEGITLAGVLLFGTDDLIEEVLPSYKLELAKCVANVNRYDDRITLRTNLIETVDSAMGFIEKYLPSPFYLEGVQRIDLRNTIFREIIANMLVHKEYISPEPSSLIIYKDKIIAQNANLPRINGLITLQNTYNYSKNPQIVKIFRMLGLVEDFGTGIPNLFKYCKIYTGFEPIIFDENRFKFILNHNFFEDSEDVIDKKVPKLNTQADEKVPKLNTQADEKVPKLSTQADEKVKLILEFCQTPRTTTEIATYLKLKSRKNILTRLIKPLLEQNLLTRTEPNKINSPKQKYQTIKM